MPSSLVAGLADDFFSGPAREGTMSDEKPMTDEELAEMETSATESLAWLKEHGGMTEADPEDILRLVTEVRRLRALVEKHHEHVQDDGGYRIKYTAGCRICDGTEP